ncbi:hypothetical protein Nepgr_020534 [Nepenthes gracilis]|uniref:Calmodulin-binding domain-containing protein n=1 Tax=Nepenthes gracilis TaxID=150966 RepID=A0AAD3SVB5_NEPGR|nr:hypothetical protein Nepgr_020534 [Nepenthes gracilis]
MKKLKKLRSMKVTNLDRLMRRKRVTVTEDPEGLVKSALTDPCPRYMKATSCSNARNESSQAAIPGTPESVTDGGSNTRRSSASFSGQKSSGILTRKNCPNKFADSTKYAASRFDEAPEIQCSDVVDDVSVETRSAKSLKRMSSLMRLRRMPSLKSRRYSTKSATRNAAFPGLSANKPGASRLHHDNAVLSSGGCNSEAASDCVYRGGSDNQDSIVKAEAKPERRVEKSRSIKLTKLRSKKSHRRLQKSRFDQASVEYVDESTMEILSDAEISDSPSNYAKSTKASRQKPVNAATRKLGLNALRFLSKMPSLRSRTNTGKNRSEVRGMRIVRHTYSSTLKNCQLPETSTLHVCPYNYCCLNGRSCALEPPLSTFLSYRRQLLKTQKKMESRDGASKSGPILCACNEDLDENIPQDVDERRYFDSNFELNKNDSKMNLSDLGLHNLFNQMGKLSIAARKILPEDNEETTNDKATVSSTSAGKELEELTAANEANSTGSLATDIVFDTQKYTKMWRLLYHHVISSKAAEAENDQGTGVAEKEQDKDENMSAENSCIDTSQNCYNINHDADGNHSFESEKLELEQIEAIKMIREAVDEILSIPVVPSDQSIIPCTIGDHGSVQKQTSKNMSSPKEEKVESNEEKPSQTEMSNGYSKLKKLIVTTTFIKAMNKLQKINSRKPRYRSIVANWETVHLNHLIMDQRKSAEEWMLDYALKQIIAKLDSSQQRKVALLSEAFEAVIPQLKGMSVNCHPMRTEPAEHLASDTAANKEEEKFITSDHDLDNIAQKPHDNFSCLCGDAPARSAKQDHEAMIPFLDRELCDNDHELNDINLQIHNRGTAEEALTQDNDETDSNYEKSKPSAPMKDPERDCKNVTADGIILSDKQKQTSMWHLIYQHIKSGIKAEVGSQLLEEAMKEQNSGGDPSLKAKSETNVERFVSNCESVELTQNDAVNLVQEAIDGILLNHCQLSEDQSNSAVINLEWKHPHEFQGRDRTPIISTSTSSNNGRFQVENKKAGNDSSLDTENAWFSTAVVTTSEKIVKESVGGKSEQEIPKGYNKLKKVILCNKFIKVMEKMQKFYRQRQQYLQIKPDPESENVILRHCLKDQKKNAEEWMLDYALQQVIAKLDRAEQRRVELLIQAFETIRPDLGETSKGLCYNKTERTEYDSSAGKLGMKQDQIHENRASSSQIEERNSGGSESVAVKTYDPMKPPSTNDNGERLSTNSKISSNSFSIAPLEMFAARKDKYEHSKPAYEFVEEPSQIQHFEYDYNDSEPQPVEFELDCNASAQPEDFKDDHNASSQPENFEDDCSSTASDKISMDAHKYTSMWHLIYQHIKSGVAEKLETQMKGEVDANRPIIEAETMPERISFGSSQSSFDSNSDGNMEIQRSDSISVELQQKDAIMLVQEAVDEILLIDEKTCNDQSGREIFNQKHSDGREPNISDNIAAPQEEEREIAVGKRIYPKSPKSYSNLSKVILCKKFIKAMEKMRKFNQRGSKQFPQQHCSEAESIHLKSRTLSEKKGCEDWMLDYALQHVIRKLAPAQKKRVALLVEAFETLTPVRNPWPTTDTMQQLHENHIYDYGSAK